MKLWRAKSETLPEIIWIKARTKPECKKKLRAYLRSREYWEGEPDLSGASEIFKAYTDLRDCPGLSLDETRGDVLVSLVDPGRDFILPDDVRNKKEKEN